MNQKPEKYGLRKEDTEFIRKICASHPEIEKAILYVLRDTGEFSLTSDLEIALCGAKISAKVLGKVMNAIKNESTTHCWFDIVHYEGLETQDLRDFIDDNGIILFQKNQSEEENIFD
jgi:hypothetical protein